PSSSPPPGAPATADVMTTLGPFVADPSGLPLPVAGVRFVVASFHGMTLSDTTPASAGSSPSVKLPGVRAVVRQSAYEGVTNWIVGYDVTGCLTAEVSAAAITIVVPHA
ncbi:MAG TPA: hypothetical protein VEY67_10190, partial [Candidatus Dormibacteraeota bacterium]|nr:hypothetical protein [Candidatus Dormibacteraeota bacterium]